jgi:hypothetical protein
MSQYVIKSLEQPGKESSLPVLSVNIAAPGEVGVIELITDTADIQI